MTSQNELIEEAQRQIAALRTTDTRITLLALSAPRLPASVVAALVRSASATLDLIGSLGDGSFGLLSLRSHGPDGGAGVEHRFLMRLQGVLSPLAARHDVGPVSFRAVHRWACELNDWADLFDSLRDAPAIPLHIPTERRYGASAEYQNSAMATAMRFLRPSSASDGSRT
ncbi:hypothetical protein [Telmatospirillum sp.]|uniref:hypothetical protein n=1 Tax=Telmatospirillum sp. TaxID=2079197 RepID=UPI0028479A4E|nr:hypothetical protein [Telmatospirillum sp.]MDR3439448.1 hypothetical protein [Telmatospirillum sp.]